MALHYETSKRRLLRGETEVTIRAMKRGGIAALRRFDDEVTATLDSVNAQIPPGGAMTYPGGPWADDEELREHFDKYADRGFITLLAEDDDGRIVGFADLWAADEPAPFGPSLNVECIDFFREYYLAGLETVLLAEAEKVARHAALPALDIGTNTCSGDYPSLRRFGLKVFYEFDYLACRCGKAPNGPQPHRRFLTPNTANLRGLIKVSHWSPTDFTFRGETERTSITELTWPTRRAIVEFWRFDLNHTGDDPPVPPNIPNKSELYVDPEALSSVQAISEILAKCTILAGEAGAEQIELACPCDIEPAGGTVDVMERRFGFAWMRKQLTDRLV